MARSRSGPNYQHPRTEKKSNHFEREHWRSPLEQTPGALNGDPESFQPVFAEIGKWLRAYFVGVRATQSVHLPVSVGGGRKKAGLRSARSYGPSKF